MKVKNQAGETVVEFDDAADDEVKHAEQVREMYELHRDVGRKAMKIALAVLDKVDADDVPVQVAVQLLKFGAELERRSLLGVESDDEDDDPFAALVKAVEEGSSSGG